MISTFAAQSVSVATCLSDLTVFTHVLYSYRQHVDLSVRSRAGRRRVAVLQVAEHVLAAPRRPRSVRRSVVWQHVPVLHDAPSLWRAVRRHVQVSVFDVCCFAQNCQQFRVACTVLFPRPPTLASTSSARRRFWCAAST